jgi:hypothetical protein
VTDTLRRKLLPNENIGSSSLYEKISRQYNCC